MENKLECLRCGYKWVKKFDSDPKTCPWCRSPYWKKPLTPYWKSVREANKEKKNEPR
jgi:hypothetical protein